MPIKLTSYQKLKLQIEKLEHEKYELRKTIAEKDEEKMEMVRKIFFFEANLEETYWQGVPWNGQFRLFQRNGIFNIMEEGENSNLDEPLINKNKCACPDKGTKHFLSNWCETCKLHIV